MPEHTDRSNTASAKFQPFPDAFTRARPPIAGGFGNTRHPADVLDGRPDTPRIDVANPFYTSMSDSRCA